MQIKNNKNGKRRLILVGLLFLMVIVLFVLFSRNKAKKSVVAGNAAVETSATPETLSSSKQLSRILYNDGWESYQVSQLSRSIAKWEIALELWPSNSAARVKLDTAKKELRGLVEDGYARGLASFQSLHYARAIREWEAVLAILGGSQSEQYNKIVSNLNEAKNKLKEGNL